jgi:hypothetical protein
LKTSYCGRSICKCLFSDVRFGYFFFFFFVKSFEKIRNRFFFGFPRRRLLSGDLNKLMYRYSWIREYGPGIYNLKFDP